jgi:hypothetical protein
MLALQAGVPAGCIAHDSRTIEACEAFGVPVVHHTELGGRISRHQLPELFRFDPDHFRHCRYQRGIAYAGMLRAAELTIAPDLAALA